MHQKKLGLRVIGFLTSLIVTISVYLIVIHPEFFDLSSEMAVRVIFILAILQATFQSIFFLDIWEEEDLLWNVGFYVSTLSVIGIIIVFSLWIMESLNYNMMANG